MTEMAKARNRVSFATCADEYGDDAMGKGLGMLREKGTTGTLRVQKKETRRAWRTAGGESDRAHSHVSPQPLPGVSCQAAAEGDLHDLWRHIRPCFQPCFHPGAGIGAAESRVRRQEGARGE